MKTSKQVSVLISAYNRPQWLGEAIKSVVDSDYKDIEIIVRNSSDAEHREAVDAVARQYPVRLVHGFNQGVGHSLNELIKEAHGEYVMFLPDDDSVKPSLIGRLVDLLDTCEVACTHPEFMDSESQPYSGEHRWLDMEKGQNGTRAQMKSAMFKGTPFVGGVMYRKSLVDKIGPQDETLRQLPDMDFYLRALEVGEMKIIEEPLYRFRIHEGNTSSPTPENLRIFEQERDTIRKRYFFKTMKVMIATPFYENKGYSPYIRSMFQTVYTLARHSTLEFDFQEISGGSYIDHNRNMMANAFLESDCTHLFFLDSDQSWDVQGFLNILKADVDVVGAAYPVKNNWVNYGVTIKTNEDFTPVVNDSGLISADKVPTGFMKIHRRVFEALKKANPDDWYHHGKNGRLYNFFGHLTVNHVRYGEDISFGIRWQRIGGKIWLEPRVTMGHYGVQGWYGNYDQYLRMQAGGDLDPAAGFEELLAKAA